MEDTQTPQVSIIVPNYNYARYLDERLESILNQTYQDFELILLDDASSDNSVEILDKYKGNPHVSAVVVNGKNSGSPFKQWRKGIGLAKGKWIWIAEADDSSKPDFLETCMRYANQEENVSVIYTGTCYIDGDSRAIERKDVNGWDGRDCINAACFDGKDFALYNLYWGNIIQNASATVFRKEYALQMAGHFLWDMRNTGDWIFWFDMARQGRVVEIYKSLNLYRCHLSQTQKGQLSGNWFIECMQSVKYFDTVLPVKWGKRHACHGWFYHFLRDIKDRHLKKTLKQAYKETFRSSIFWDYIYTKLNMHFKFLPGAVTAKKERLRKKK